MPKKKKCPLSRWTGWKECDDDCAWQIGGLKGQVAGCSVAVFAAAVRDKVYSPNPTEQKSKDD